jgi:mono/diheme cytochrome c family protein
MGTNLKVFGIVLGTLLFYTALANMIPQIESDVPQELSFSAQVTPEELVAAGEQLYNGAGGCTACHGLGTRAPNLLTDEGGTGQVGARCSMRVPGKTCKEYLHESMVDPAAYVVEGYQPIMPDMSRTLSAVQIWAMIAYLETLGGEVTVTQEDLIEAEAASGGAQPVPTTNAGQTPPGAGAASPTDPQALLQNNQCMACHQLGGQGGPIGPPFDGIGARLTAEQIRRSILEPNADTAQGYAAVAGTMPQTFGQQLTAAQLESLVRYLSGLR